MLSIVGYAKVKTEVKNTRYIWGDLSEIEGEELRVIDRNPRGDCLCLNPNGTGLVDISVEDVSNFRYGKGDDNGTTD